MKLSKIKKITKSSGKVVDITVKNNHNFFCNNLLIGNSDYRNEVKIIVDNIGDGRQSDLEIKHGDRIAQFIFLPYYQAKFNIVDKLDETQRNGGFGSTGSR